MEYTTINDSRVGVIKYKKIGDLTADELTGAITDERVKTINPITNEVTYISNYELFNENHAAASFSQEKRAHNGVDLYKVKYRINNKGEIDVVTGLIAVPVGVEANDLPLLSWQHGTTFTANESPSGVMRNDRILSKPVGSIFEGQLRSTETWFNVARFGGNGYVVVAADYNGLGDSKTPQYYAIDKPTTQATVGMIDAAKVILRDLDVGTNKLYLNGWSQGAVNTLFLERNLQDRGTPIAKSSPLQYVFQSCKRGKLLEQ